MEIDNTSSDNTLDRLTFRLTFKSNCKLNGQKSATSLSLGGEGRALCVVKIDPTGSGEETQIYSQRGI
jgi:hypothetical protein